MTEDARARRARERFRFRARARRAGAEVKPLPQPHPVLLAVSPSRPLALRPYSFTRLSSCALTATTIVLSDISTAPTAGCSTTPQCASTPAASGMARTL